ncbi:MAG: hypothetical protein H0T79_24205 [Deltaproteobacteria bacterium]|nr:hypothetical protein [Deltaproteobacteria bacterium]
MRLLAIGWLIAATACSGPTITATTCATASDCNLFNVAGTCEATGFCSFPDATCAGGSRYSPGAGDELANTCIGGPSACGAKDEVCCGASTCGPDLTCVGEIESARTCECGALGEACCDGTTCASGLACSAGTCASSTVLQVAVGAGHVCALRVDKTVWCWGFDWKAYPSGTPGLGASVIASPTPERIAGLDDVAEIAAGEMHTCARKADSTLWCWGHNENGQLGNGTTTHSKIAIQVPGLTGVMRFAGGRLHTCAVGSYLGAAGVWCWGRNGQGGHATSTAIPNLGRLGNGTVTDSAMPVAVDLTVAAAAGQTVKALSTGGYHSCVVLSDNAVWCWGRNTSSELGDGTTTPSSVPVKVDLSGITPLPIGVGIEEVSCSDGRRNPASTCIRFGNGAVHCWGHGTDGELGDGLGASRATPTIALSTGLGAKPVQLAAGQGARCARLDDGEITCWGTNQNGVLGVGVGGNTRFTTPSHTQVISGATQLDMSHHSACAVDGMGRLYCWGTNKRGQAMGRQPADEAESRVLEPYLVTF